MENRSRFVILLTCLDKFPVLALQLSIRRLVLVNPPIIPLIFASTLDNNPDTFCNPFRHFSKPLPFSVAFPAASSCACVCAASPVSRSNFSLASCSSPFSFCTSAVLSGFIRAVSRRFCKDSTLSSSSSYFGFRASICFSTSCNPYGVSPIAS